MDMRLDAVGGGGVFQAGNGVRIHVENDAIERVRSEQVECETWRAQLSRKFPWRVPTCMYNVNALPSCPNALRTCPRLRFHKILKSPAETIATRVK